MADTPDQGQTIKFHLIKTPSYETHHADGAVGGLTPGGGAFLAFFVERGAIPQVVTRKIEKDGTLGKVLSATGKDGVVREIQTGVILDRESVKNLIRDLEEILAKLEESESRQTDTNAQT